MRVFFVFIYTTNGIDLSWGGVGVLTFLGVYKIALPRADLRWYLIEIKVSSSQVKSKQVAKLVFVRPVIRD